MTDSARLGTPTFRLDANISMLFTHLPLLKRPAAAAAAGFRAVELWWPFDLPTPTRRAVEELRLALDAAGTQLVALNLYEGNTRGGDRGLISWPDEVSSVRANADLALTIAEATGCRIINALYGNRLEGLDASVQEDVAIDNLTFIARRAAGLGVTVVLETLNRFDSPAFPLTSLDATRRLVTAVRQSAGVSNVALLFDVYHLHRMGHDLPAAVRSNADLIAHVQLADNPGRGAPGTGAIDFESVLEALWAVHYTGYLGLEYHPNPDFPDAFPGCSTGTPLDARRNAQ